MRAPDADGRFVGLSEELRTWATSLHAAYRCWPDWRIAPADVLYGVAASWNDLKGPGICELVLSLTDGEIEWSTKASDAWMRGGAAVRRIKHRWLMEALQAPSF